MKSGNRWWLMILTGSIGWCTTVEGSESSVVIRPVAVVAPDGSICEQMAVVIHSDGTIAAVIPADQADPALTTVHAAAGSVLPQAGVATVPSPKSSTSRVRPAR